MSDELSAESIQARKDARMLQRGGHPKYCRCEWCRVDEVADELEAAAPAFAKDRAALAEQLEKPPATADSPPPVSETAAWTNAEIRRQRDAWRDYAGHLDHCVECSQMGEIGDCFDRKTLQEATTCQRCGGSARAQPNIECPVCTTSRSRVSDNG